MTDGYKDLSHERDSLENLMDTTVKFLVLVPARGGSKGIPHKNMRLLAGKPLIDYTIEAALGSRYPLRVVVSTDDEEIARVSQAVGAEVPFLRPAELASDETPTFSVVRHALQWLEQHEAYQPELVVLLQPTSPLRRSRHIDQALELLLSSEADSVVSLCEVEHSPYWMKNVDAEGRVSPFMSMEEEYTRRQALPKVYRLNGAIFVTRSKVIIRENRLLGDDTRAYIMNQVDSIDIDTELDFKLAELLIKER